MEAQHGLGSRLGTCSALELTFWKGFLFIAICDVKNVWVGGSQAREPGHPCWKLSHPTPAAPGSAVAAFLRVAWAPLASESPGMLVETQNPDFTVNHLNQAL